MTEMTGGTPGQQPPLPQQPYGYDPTGYTQPPQTQHDPQYSHQPHQPHQPHQVTAPYPPAPQPPQQPKPPRPPRPRLRTALRWSAAVLLLAVAGSATGYGLTRAERSDLPGLATRSDGRWDYPDLRLPALPSGSPRPFDESNQAQIHHVDIRDLLLPAPAGAKSDKGLPGGDGWVKPADFVKIYDKGERADLQQGLTDDAVRHIAASGWTMPDGTRTEIYLLRFNTAALAAHFYDEQLTGGVDAGRPLTGAPEAVIDERWSEKYGDPDVEHYVYDEPKPRDEEHIRQAHLLAGDTLGLVIQAKKGTTARIPFHQTVILQQQLLG